MAALYIFALSVNVQCKSQKKAINSAKLWSWAIESYVLMFDKVYVTMDVEAVKSSAGASNTNSRPTQRVQLQSCIFELHLESARDPLAS